MACYKGGIGCVNAEDVWLGLNDAMQWDMGHPFKFISDLNNDPEDNKSVTTMKVIVLMMAIAVSFFHTCSFFAKQCYYVSHPEIKSYPKGMS